MTSSDLFADLRIPSDYGRNPRRPRFKEATTLEDVEPNVVGTMQRLAPETASAWREMKRSAADAGVQLLLVSGFRSIRHQADIIRRKLEAGQSIEQILSVNAAPGFSEHHTGRAVDIATPGARPLTAEFDLSSAFLWLKANAVKFGFRMPYSRGNRFGFEYEPWHWSQIDAPERRRKGDHA
jgi:D-alanyl-D-alanine carboxypeptidase